MLAAKSARLGDTLGKSNDYGGDWVHRFIAERIIAQYDKHPAEFEAFLAEALWHGALITTAEAAGMHPYTLLYGIPQHVLDSLVLSHPERLMCVIQLGDMEPHILEQLVLRNGRKPIDAALFGIGMQKSVPSIYEARSQLAQCVLGHELSYAMMVAGATLEDIMLAPSSKLAACMTWGVSPAYASALLRRGYEPDVIADLHRNGIALEYV